jgi:hypothetical protein
MLDRVRSSHFQSRRVCQDFVEFVNTAAELRLVRPNLYRHGRWELLMALSERPRVIGAE